jgi:hypothetical protein
VKMLMMWRVHLELRMEVEELVSEVEVANNK